MSSRTWTVTETSIADVTPLFAAHHAYASVGALATYAFAVLEAGVPVAAFLWNPPAPGAAKSVCPALAGGVLSLSPGWSRCRASSASSSTSPSPSATRCAT